MSYKKKQLLGSSLGCGGRHMRESGHFHQSMNTHRCPGEKVKCRHIQAREDVALMWMLILAANKLISLESRLSLFVVSHNRFSSKMLKQHLCTAIESRFNVRKNNHDKNNICFLII